MGSDQVSSKSEVRGQAEIVFLLRQAIKSRELFSVTFSQGKDSMSTLLLDISPERGHLTFDASRDAAINQKVVAGGRLHFSGLLRGVKLQFAVIGSKVVDYQGGPALQVKIPELLNHFQNRDSFRVKSQVPTYCQLKLGDGSKLRVPVDELSVGGIQLILSYDASNFSIGQKLPGCELEMGGLGNLLCQLEVRNTKEITSRISGNRAIGMGCRFVGLGKSDEARISRFVAQQERKSGGSGLFGL